MRSHVVESRREIFLLPFPLVEGALAVANAAEVEPEHRAPNAREALRAPIHHLGVHRPAELRMRVREHDRGSDRAGARCRLFWSVEKRLEETSRADEISDRWH